MGVPIQGSCCQAHLTSSGLSSNSDAARSWTLRGNPPERLWIRAMVCSSKRAFSSLGTPA